MAFGSESVRAFGFILFAFVGFGSALLSFSNPRALGGWGLSAAASTVIIILVGFVLVEIRIWSTGVPVFAVLSAGAAATHVRVTARWIRARRASAAPGVRQWVRDHRADYNRTHVMTAVVLVVGLAVVCGASAAVNDLNPENTSAFFGAVSPLWYVGMALVTVGTAIAFRGDGRLAGLAVIVMGLAVTLTPTLAYVEPHAPYALKHAGVTLYIMKHGSVDSSIDIYQSWPGLFAGIGWLCRSVSLSDPVAIARWWPPFIDLATLLVFRRLAFTLLRDNRRAWVAGLMFVLGNTIGQDYFSPQSIGLLLAVAMFSLVCVPPRSGERLALSEWVALAGLAIAVAVTHQLTPYIVGGVTIVLALFGMIRSRLTALVVLLPAVTWALINVPTLKRYISPGQIGAVTSNILPKGYAASGITLHKSNVIHYASYAEAAALALIAALAGVVFLVRHSRFHLALGICALSGLGLFLVNSYGNEGAFRVALFALPWLAIMAADWSPTRRLFTYGFVAIALPILVVSYLFANLGLDYIRAVRSGDVAALRHFEDNAPSHSVLYVLGYNFVPEKSNARYPILNEHRYPYVQLNTPTGIATPRQSYLTLMQFLVARGDLRTRGAVYVLAASEARAAMQELSLSTPEHYSSVAREIAASSKWRLVEATDTASLFRLAWYIRNSVQPTLGGVPQVGKSLAASRGKWISLRHLTFTYQWQRCTAITSCVDIAGADSATYHLQPADRRYKVREVTTATDSKGYHISVPTAPSQTVKKG